MHSNNKSHKNIDHPRAAKRRGANTVEYLILVGVVALGALASFQMFGSTVSAKTRSQGVAVGNIGDGLRPAVTLQTRSVR